MKSIPKILETPRINLKIIPFNADREYTDNGMRRGLLCAEWDNSTNRKEKIVAIGINPSTAHNGKSDTTITKLCRFLDMHGFNNLIMLNLYEDVSSVQLKGSKVATDFSTKREAFDEADIILIVWGFDDKKDLRELKNSALEVLEDYDDKLYCIATDSGKFPAHPSRMHYDWNIIKMNDRPEWKHLVVHRNMYGPSCEVASANNEGDFKIYCHREHKICRPKNCNKCKFFGGSEMGKGISCVWEESYEDIRGGEHIVPHDEAYMEFQRVENPDLYKKMQKMIEDGELDLCKAWQDLD
ncbi:MAG: DUF1643 domain-containing protein [Phascolarctobacterium sp.]|nr:DUF1643 domain-containing protein [Phascolarctobacterium sp.]